MKCTVGGALQSVKRVRAATEEGAGPSQRGEDEPLFLELELEGVEARSETAGLEIPCDVAAELTEALQVQTSALQGQAHLKERLCTQMEQLSISLDQNQNSHQ